MTKVISEGVCVCRPGDLVQASGEGGGVGGGGVAR